MSYANIGKVRLAAMLSGWCAVAGVLLSGCTNGPNATANLNANANSAIANKNAATASTTPFAAREPDRYRATTVITVQPTGNAPQTNVPPMQFEFARLGADVRVSFRLPDPVGEVVYLEKSPLKYLIFPSRNQYVELDPNELGFQLGNVMSPAAAMDRIKEKTQSENLGTETVNGRQAIKYRIKAEGDTHTKAGTAQADSIVYVDQETGLPLRSEIDTTSSSGAGARVTTTTENLDLNPDPGLFQVPTQMKKVSSAELKQQVQSFVSGLRALAGYLRQQGMVTPAAGQP
jgi:outer membrane lipoprotein-sorting protein